jgi:predicted transglutaminase-like cysteine proteinase
MIDLTFPGYTSFNAGPDDPLRIKWNAMRAQLDIPDSLILPSMTKLAGLSMAVNKEIVFDRDEAESLEVWQTPAQTLKRKRGDCKDYALVKYALLQKIGVPVRIVLGEIKSALKFNPKHAFCAASFNGVWCALDNKFDQSEPLPYRNWIPASVLRDDSVVHYGQPFSMAEMLK